MARSADDTSNARSLDEPAAEWVDIARLAPWKRNPRKNDDNVKRVMESIKRFGFAAPIVARKADGEVIAGHTRLKAAEALGLKRVPVRYLDLDPADAHLLALADNRLNELSPWDTAELTSILSEYGIESAALAGWDSADLDKMGAELLAGGDDVQAGECAMEVSGADAGESCPAGTQYLVFDAKRMADQAAADMCGKRWSDYAPARLEVMNEINKLAEGGKASHLITDLWYPHRYDVIAGKSPETANQALANGEVIRGSALLCVDYNRPISVRNIRDNAAHYKGRQVARQFPPALARDLYRKHAPLNGRVLDPCAGWGGRIVGWLGSRVNGRYVGFDACSDTVASAGRMIADLGIEGASVSFGAFEDQELEPCSFDFAMTSPPYFDVEKYGADAEQSTIRYKTYPEWVRGFLEPFVRKTLDALRPGAAFVVNVSDAGKNKIASDIVRIAQAAGSTVESQATVSVSGNQSAERSNAYENGIEEDLVTIRKAALRAS